MKFKCYIVDDEPLALNVIEQHLAKFTQFEVCGKSTEPLEALGQIKVLQPDLIFLDIQMPEITGLELIESIQNKPAIIITTAYREYAVEGFELNVLDYLVKPIPFKRFIKAIDKFLEQKLAHTPVPVVAPVLPVNDHAFLLVKAERKTLKIALEDILYVEGVKDYVKIVLKDQKILTKTSIGNFFNELPAERFVRIHKSFVVAIDKIEAYTAHDVEIQKMEIPIGRMYKEAFVELMEGR
ncbi:MAG TPA: response regulator transcription factor [Haliscomenobacter sp.]|uniref:LytR/AlgR family response regulator transcription factor n=1 Tax=Haliscomenobacter sp. TaxID=2717303 RepID=UPI002BF13CA0|nr:response regulator transcription factor [Haliscomenobacter sp.]HOY16960.1 response regulator transcription factor [Haliscomenobacter sp.]HPH17162.1 response regulator transcription factor [Haliscomenobacter sp.]